MIFNQNDLLAKASEYEERAAVLSSPSFRFLERDMEHEAQRNARRDALETKREKAQKKFAFAS